LAFGEKESQETVNL